MAKRETDNHNLNKYDPGDDWDYNEDMDHIEERLVIRDADANKSNYTPHAGALYIADDTGAVYDGDGGAWTLATREVNELVASKVSAGGAEITNQTFVSAYMSSNQSYSTADSFVTVEINSEGDDHLNEYDDSNYQFVPDSTQWYFVKAKVTFQVASDGDRLAIRLQNTTDSNAILLSRANAGWTNDETLVVTGIEKLSAGDTYEVQAANFSSDDTLEGFESVTNLVIARWPVPA